MARAWLVIVSAWCCLLLAQAAEIPALAGETKLNATEADQALSLISERLAKRGALKAQIVTETDDPMSVTGKRVEEGELLMDGPHRIRRTFTKPNAKTWVLDGAQITEYLPRRRKWAFIKDFSKAPKALALLRAAVNVDAKALADYFDVTVFKTAEGAHRLVLVCKERKDGRQLYKRIQAKLAPNAPFFHEIEFEDASDVKVSEKYSNMEAVEKVDAAAFKLEIPADAEVQTDHIEDKG